MKLQDVVSVATSVSLHNELSIEENEAAEDDDTKV